MDKQAEVGAIIKKVVETAAAKQGWSFARLARHLGIAQQRLHRWKAGEMIRFELDVVIELFRLADMDMNQEFGLYGGGIDGESGMDLQGQIDNINERLERIEPIADFISLMSRLFSGAAGMGTEKYDPLYQRLAEKSDAAVADAIKRAEASTGKDGKDSGKNPGGERKRA